MSRAFLLAVCLLSATACGEQPISAPVLPLLTREQRLQDIEINRMVRKRLLEEPAFSVHAHNVFVQSVGGKLLLQGAVGCEEERLRIRQIASQVSGVSMIRDRLEVLGPPFDGCAGRSQSGDGDARKSKNNHS